MTALLIARRDLAGYFSSMPGYLVIAAVLLANGVLFHASALGGPYRPSAEVLATYFFVASGTTLVTSALATMRLIAGERERGTIELLFSSPARDGAVVVGKYLSAMAFVLVSVLASAHLPLLVLAHGTVSAGHVLAGTLGLVLLGSASVAVGILASALCRTQLAGCVTAAVLLSALLLCWLLGQLTEPPVSGFLASAALYGVHLAPFQRGVIHLRDVTYYLAVTAVALHGATCVLRARRWR